MKSFPRLLQTVLFSSRWLLAPFYFCLSIALLAVLVKLVQHASHMALHFMDASESQVILDVLSLIDMTLVGSLIVIVIFSGYENFVSPVDHSIGYSWPTWMGDIDFTNLKLKLMSSIVAISAIQLLRAFMDLRNNSDRDLWWSAGIHMVFVISGLLLAVSDRFSNHHPTEKNDH
ncbi:MAG: TIGR00645 family protein [Hyphomicrobiales bacterium]|nr:TIGR00645 family protein [Hyphomicrobiales bacterium]